MFAGSAFLALIVIAASVGRVLHVVNLFAPASGGELAVRYASDPAAPSGASTSAVASARADEVVANTTERTRVLSEGLDDALRSARAAEEPSRPGELQPQRPLTLATLDENVGLATAGTRRDSAGAQVEDLARKVAPSLAREALAPSADHPTRNADVEHELLETWTQQKQILAGQQGTMDTELKDIFP